ncbi:MAG TPA: MscL family protein [Candidatus Saccharimonadales bacterium]
MTVSQSASADNDKKPAPTLAQAKREVSAAKKEVAAAEERTKKAEAKVVRLANKLERLKDLDKVGVSGKVQGFIEFLREQSVVGLAIGLVLGTQAKALVDQMIASFINPLVGLLLPGGGTLKDKAFTIAWGGKTGTFGWGAFVLAILTFVIVAAVVYFAFKGLKLDKLDKKKEN